MLTSPLLPLLLACEPTRVTIVGGEVAHEPTPEVESTPEPEEEPDEEPEEDVEIEQVGGTGVPGDDDEDEEESEDEQLYRDDVVGELHLELTDEEARALLREPTEWTSATLVRDDERLVVAVRLKGSSTYMPFGSKPSWKVDVDRLVEDQEYLGHGEFNLHNQILDPSVMSEALTFGAYRALGVPAPRVGYVRLWVNDDDYGLYTVVEPPKRAFLRRWFDEDEGDLYENGYQDCDVTHPSCFDVEQDDMEADGLDDLKAITRMEGDEWREAMMALFDWDMFLDAMAMEAMIAHWDSYSYDVSNYRLFHSASTGLMYFLPWSADLGFGYRPWSYPYCGMYGVAPGDYDDGVLSRQCEQDETCHQELVDHMEALLEAWEATDPVAELDRLTELLRPEVESDPKAMYDVDDFDQHVACVREWIEERPDEIRAWIAGERE